MRIPTTRQLFAWDWLEDGPDIQTIREFLAVVPDEKLLAALRRGRANGSDDYDVATLWGVLLLRVALRHVFVESTLHELRRNRDLRRMISIESVSGVPGRWNISRFTERLGEEPYLSLLREVFDEMIKNLGEAAPDLGRNLSGDASHLSGRRSRSAKGDGGDLPKAGGGRKAYTDEDGKVTRIIEWFGYKFHALVDTKHEVAVAYRVGPANGGDAEELPELVEEAKENLPEDRMETLAYDKAADDDATHKMLHQEGIRPVIENRSLWKGEGERMLPGHDGDSNVVYDEAGTLYCYDLTSETPVRRPMAYIGHEADRGTLKYRCPARHEGWTCPRDAACNGGRKYGKTVRVKREIDLRRFPPIPRATKTFERLYRGRSAVERFNGRLKVYWGADDGNVTGARRFHAMIGTIMVVHAAMATLLARAPRYEGTLSKTRLTPIAKVLRANGQV